MQKRFAIATHRIRIPRRSPFPHSTHLQASAMYGYVKTIQVKWKRKRWKSRIRASVTASQFPVWLEWKYTMLFNRNHLASQRWWKTNGDRQQYNNHAFKQHMMHSCRWLIQSVWLGPWMVWVLSAAYAFTEYPLYAYCINIRTWTPQRCCRHGKLFSIHSRWWKSFSRL